VRSKNTFCKQSCAAIYNNEHKTHGTRRSKLEGWLEEQLTLKYPNLEIHFNRKDAINSELDFYFPSLRLAFELNGIFHYEPIYGIDKLSRTQNNDNRKFQACIEHGIELCIIDSSSQKYFKVETSQKYLDIITKLVTSKLEASKTDYVEVL
jgi:very-short-patch-repair endonuclease